MAKAGRITTAFAGLLIAAALSGCGFQPLYSGAGFQALPGLEIDTSDDRMGYLVEDALRDHLGGGRSEYRVEIDTNVVERPLGLSVSARATRYRADLRVNYRLTGPSDFAHVGQFTEAVYYEAPSDPYALIAARATAEERAADVIATRLTRELATVLRRVDSGLAP
jgi:LPS-assembly lipoprotein